MPGGGGKGGGSSTSTVNVNNGPISVDSDSTVDINGLDSIDVSTRVDPLEVTTRQELSTPEPLKSESSVKSDSAITANAEVKTDNRNAVSVDLKPVVLDVCTTNTTNLPRGEIVQPIDAHFGITWFGIEVFGFNVRSTSRTVLQDLPKKPSVDWAAQHNAPRGPSGGSAPTDGGGGLRIRLKPDD